MRGPKLFMCSQKGLETNIRCSHRGFGKVALLAEGFLQFICFADEGFKKLLVSQMVSKKANLFAEGSYKC